MSYRADRFTVVIDTNILVGALRRNIILSLAEAGLFRPRWSAKTIDEEFVRTFEKLYDAGRAVGARQRAFIERAFPEARAVGDERIIDALNLPDPDDNHVLAAAISTKASLIVTDNLKDFPDEHLKPHEIEALSADEFIADSIDLSLPEAALAIKTMRQRLKNPAMDAEALLVRIEQVGLIQTANLLAPYKGLL